MNKEKAYAQLEPFVARHQVYILGGEMIEIMADGKKEARAIMEAYGYKVLMVTCMK